MSRFVTQVLHLVGLSVQRTPLRTPTAWLATSRDAPSRRSSGALKLQ